MPRLRRYLPPLVMLLPVIFICGKLLLTPVVQESWDFWNSAGGYTFQDFPQRGWPWIYHETVPSSSRPFRGWLLAADVAVLLAIIAVSWLAISWWWRRNGYRFRISLRTCLLLVILPAAAMGWWMSHVRAWREEQRLIREYEDVASFETDYIGPEWLQRIWPKKDLPYLHRSTHLTSADTLSEEEATKLLDVIPRMSYLNSFECRTAVETQSADGAKLRSPLLIPSRVQAPAALGNIETLTIVANVDITDETLEVVGALPRLRELEVGWCDYKITDVGVAYLAGLRNLKTLNLSGTEITDAACETLSKLESLQELYIEDCPEITDRGVRQLLKSPSLTALRLDRHNLSEAVLKLVDDEFEPL